MAANFGAASEILKGFLLRKKYLLSELVHDVPTLGVVEEDESPLATPYCVAKLQMTRAASRKDKKYSVATVEMRMVKSVDVLRGIPIERLSIGPAPSFLIIPPLVVGLGSCCVPVVEDVDPFSSKKRSDFGDLAIPKRPDNV